MKSARHRVANY